MPSGNVHDLVHCYRNARIVHDEDRPGSGCDGILDECLVDVKRVRPDIYEHRRRPAQDHRVGGRHEGVGGHDHFVAWPEIEQHRSHLQRGRAAVGKEGFGRAGARLQPFGARPGEGPVTG